MFLPLTGLSQHDRAHPAHECYTLLILVRNTVTGFDGVPPDVKDAAVGMGYSRNRQLLRVELPLALPAIIIGIRIATVTTIGLVAITATHRSGRPRRADVRRPAARVPPAPHVWASCCRWRLAVVADLLLVLAQRLATPWARAGRRRERKAAA